jgi:hypothetical protein
MAVTLPNSHRRMLSKLIGHVFLVRGSALAGPVCHDGGGIARRCPRACSAIRGQVLLKVPLTRGSAGCGGCEQAFRSASPRSP